MNAGVFSFGNISAGNMCNVGPVGIPEFITEESN